MAGKKVKMVKMPTWYEILNVMEEENPTKFEGVLEEIYDNAYKKTYDKFLNVLKKGKPGKKVY